tara:strand:+ start:591 stop:1370 length:780 start_codon:yes stop_codon:yes gene_type:complete
MDITQHIYLGKDYDGSRLKEWIPTDSKLLFLDRLEKDPTNPCLLHYLKYPITYKLNNYGFRTPVDFVDEVEGNLFLGCSHTFGIGHYLENTWSWKLNEYVGGKFLNAAAGGAGIGTGFRLFYFLKGIIKPKNVFLYFPHPYRFEYFDGKRNLWETVNINSGRNINIIAEKNNMEMYYYLHFNAIKNLCTELNIPLYAINNENIFSVQHEIFPDCARDYHSPPSDHINIFERFKQAYDNKEEAYSKPLSDHLFDGFKHLS